jgi:SAM-dependent methyltransferase
MEGNWADIISIILRNSMKPPLFTPGEALFWDDPHISKGMLEAHLNPDNDLASRRHATIDKEVSYLISSGTLQPGDRVLDLGCGPGLYANRLAAQDIKVTGIDISKRSLGYAITRAKKKGLDVEYRRMDFFDIDFSGEYDAVLQTHGEMCTFPDDKRDELLAKLRRALKPAGRFVFDVTTRTLRMRDGLENGWYASGGGFWRPGNHLVLEQGFDYPEDNVWLDRYIVVDSECVKIYHNWFHDYDLESLSRVLQNAGFGLIHVWNDFTGTPYKKGGDFLAVVAERR